MYTDKTDSLKQETKSLSYPCWSCNLWLKIFFYWCEEDFLNRELRQRTRKEDEEFDQKVTRKKVGRGGSLGRLSCRREEEVELLQLDSSCFSYPCPSMVKNLQNPVRLCPRRPPCGKISSRVFNHKLHGCTRIRPILWNKKPQVSESPSLFLIGAGREIRGQNSLSTNMRKRSEPRITRTDANER